MSYETVLIPKLIPDGTIVSAKGQFHNSYTFWAMPILIFSPVQIIISHPLQEKKSLKYGFDKKWHLTNSI